WIWFVGIVLPFPWLIYKYQQANTQKYDEVVEACEFASPDQNVPYLSIDNNTLSCHLYRPDQRISHEFDLNNIHGLIISTLRRNVRTLSIPAMLNQKAQEVGGEIIPEIYGDEHIYELWIYTKGIVMSRSCILIPEPWLED